MASYAEQAAFYINLEGRIRVSQQAMVPLGKAHFD
jgi:hypothetical protein